MNNYSMDLYNAKLDLYYLNEYLNNTSSLEDVKSLRKQIELLNSEIDKKFDEFNNKVLLSECNHPLWYLLEKDREYNVISYKCKCLKCGKEKSGSRDKFNYIVSYNPLKKIDNNSLESYNTLKKEFDLVYNENDILKSRKKLLIKYKA